MRIDDPRWRIAPGAEVVRRENRPPLTMRQTAEQTFDIHTLITTVASVMTGDKGSPKPLQQLDELEAYLRKNGITTKFLLPTGLAQYTSTVSQELLGICQSTLDVIASKPQADKRYPFVIGMVEVTHATARLARMQIQPQRIPVHLTTPQIQEHSYFQATVATHEAIAQRLSQIADEPEDKPSVARTHLSEDVVDLLKERSGYGVPGVPNMYTAKFGGVSLEQLMSIQDPVAFRDRALAYLVNLPKGDLTWRDLAGAVFLYEPLIQDLEYAATLPAQMHRYPHLYRNLFEFHMGVSHLLLEPAFPGFNPNGKFDNAMKQIFETMPELNLYLLESVLRMGITDGGYRAPIFYPDALPEHITHVYPFLGYIIKEAKGRFINIEVSGQHFLKRNEDRIVKNWRRRFGKSKGLETFIKEFSKENAQSDIEGGVTESVHSFLRSELGAVDYRDWITSVTGTEALAKQIKDSTLIEGQGRDFSFQFGRDSIPAKLGFVSIEVLPNVGETQHKFFLKRSNGKMVMGGFVEADGKVVLSPYRADPPYDQLPKVIEAIVKKTITEIEEQKKTTTAAEQDDDRMSARDAHDALAQFLHPDTYGQN